MSDDLKELKRSTHTGFLRAMAENYKNGHRWDHLDSNVCLQAAEEIDALRAAIAQLEQAKADAAPKGENAALETLMVGFTVTYCGSVSYLTDEANAEFRWYVRRTESPFCDKDNVPQWSGATPADALLKARAALGLLSQQQEVKQ